MQTQTQERQQVINLFSDKIHKESIPVVIQSQNEVILGNIHIRPALRIIDELINAEQFLAVTEAVVYDRSGTAKFRTNFMTVNKEHVVFIIPRDEMEARQNFKATT